MTGEPDSGCEAERPGEEFDGALPLAAWMTRRPTDPDVVLAEQAYVHRQGDRRRMHQVLRGRCPLQLKSLPSGYTGNIPDSIWIPYGIIWGVGSQLTYTLGHNGTQGRVYMRLEGRSPPSRRVQVRRTASPLAGGMTRRSADPDVVFVWQGTPQTDRRAAASGPE